MIWQNNTFGKTKNVATVIARGLGRVKLLVNRYAPPWQSHSLTVGLRKLAADLTFVPKS